MVNNITSILKGFNDKTLSYDEYLILADVDKNLGTFMAYKAFTKKLNLTKSDIINYQENILAKESFEQTDPPKIFECISSSYQRKKTLLEEQKDEINEYCTNNPSDNACVCVRTALVIIAQDEKENEENRIKYCDWKTQNDKFEQEYQNRIIDYNKLYKREEYELNTWRQPVERNYWPTSEPTNNLYTDRNKYSMQKVDTHGDFLWQTYDWDVVYASKYITESLQRFRLRNHPDNVAPRIQLEQPIIIPRNSIIPCCNNNIYAPSANLENIKQDCNQTIIISPEQMEEIKKQLEEERKNKEEAAAMIAAELASAKKKKIIFLIVLIVLILLGLSAFMYFNLSKQPIVLTTPSSIPSTP